jgi:hypothetical protein
MNDTHTTRRIAEDVDVISYGHPVPGKGYLPIRSFLIRGGQPVLIDTGAVVGVRGFLEAFESLVDPADLAWIVVSHPDTDHTGALPALLERAPKAKLVLNWISTGKLSAVIEPPLPRIRWVNAGESLAIGDRVLHFLRPPMYDCPSTVAVFDSKSRALFSSDAFAGFVGEMTETFAEQTSPEAALEGMSFFCRGNSPWLSDVRPERYAAGLKAIADLEPSWLLSSHFPAVDAPHVGQILARAARFPEEGRIPLPGQQALDAVLAAMAKAA